MTERIRLSITAKEVYGEGYLQTVGETFMDADCECCGECYNKLVDIVDMVGQEEPFSIFDKLGKLIKNGEGKR